jgi:tetratricopeptide (TPR) repeat protein
MARASGRREARGRAARLYGSWLAYVGRYKESLGPYDEAAALLTGAARDGARVGKAGSCLRLGRFDEAARLCRQVRRAARRRRDLLLAAGADLNEAVALHESGRPVASLDLYRRARSAFQKTGRDQLAATTVQNLANALVLIDRYEEAAPLYEEAASEFTRLGASHDAARCRYNRGALLVATDRLGEADLELARGEEGFREAGDAVHAALCRLDRGEALLRAGLRPEAVRALESARRGLRRRGPPEERTRATLLLARALLASGAARSARRILSRPLDLPSPVWKVEREELLARADALDGRYARAREGFTAAAGAHGRRRPMRRVRALHGAAFCALMEGDLTDARRALRRGRPAVDRLDLPSLAYGSAALEFLVEERAGRRPAALKALESSFDALERVREGLGPDSFRAAVVVGRERWFARAFRFLLAEPDGLSKAVTLLERWRARALVDLIGDAERVAPGDERLASLRARVAALERKADASLAPEFLRSDDSVSGPALLRSLATAERDYRDEAARRLSPVVAAAPDVDEVLADLTSGTVVLSLFADEEGTCLCVGERRGLSYAESPGRVAEIASLAEELHFVLGQFTVGGEFAERHRRRLDRRADRILEELSDRTLRPVARALERARRVVVVPHGPWHLVPFAALPLGGRRLVDFAPVVLAPSLSVLGRWGRRARGRSVVLGFRDEQAPHIADEARRVATVLRDSTLLEGEDARCDALAGRSPPRCLHVASHGRYRPDAPGMSGVRLADGWLRAVEFAALPLRGSTVVLSGCETGVSAVGAGDEVQGLVRGVLAAGGAELLASLWRVDDATTARLLTRFHELGAAGATPSLALATAQRELASEGLHPWFWAGFSLWSLRLK